jgi:hypothetical protein
MQAITKIAALTILLAASITTRSENGHNAFAENMDTKARILFPAIFFLFVAFTFISY